MNNRLKKTKNEIDILLNDWEVKNIIANSILDQKEFIHKSFVLSDFFEKLSQLENLQEKILYIIPELKKYYIYFSNSNSSDIMYKNNISEYFIISESFCDCVQDYIQNNNELDIQSKRVEINKMSITEKIIYILDIIVECIDNKIDVAILYYTYLDLIILFNNEFF